MKTMISIPTLIMASIFIVGCMPQVKAVTEDLNKPAVQHALNTPTPDTTTQGSLWAGGGAGLLTDPKAAQIGDLVTVLVQESASATRSLGTKKSTKSDRASSLSASIDYGSALANKSANPKADIGMTNSKNFDGSGSTSNSDTLTASVTSVVTYVYPNGNMYIIGRRQLTINQQPQEITFSGIIRPNDISPANTIPSSKVAQAEISYGSGGELASVTHEGWLSQALDQIWPF